jgi:hypothetical protein
MTCFRCNQRLMVFGVALLLAGCGDKSSSSSTKGDFSSPEATLATAKAAAADKDYRTFAACFTPEGQETMAAGFVMIGGMMQFMMTKDEENPEKGKASAAKIKTVLEDHGVVEGARPKITIELNADEETQNKALRKLAEPVKDKPAFIADFIAVMQEVGDKPDARIIESNATLKDVKIDGDTAKGTLVQTREKKESTSPIVFQKIDGAWKIREVPRLLN